MATAARLRDNASASGGADDDAPANDGRYSGSSAAGLAAGDESVSRGKRRSIVKAYVTKGT